MKEKTETQPTVLDDDSRLGDIGWAADHLGVSQQHMYGLLRSNKDIPFLRLGGLIRVSKPEFKRFFQEKAASGELKQPFRVPIHRKKVRKPRKRNTLISRGGQVAVVVQ